jgi:hypothetical protein
VGRGIGEVDGDGVGLHFLGLFEEAGPAGLEGDHVGAAFAELLGTALTLGRLEVQIKNAHKTRDYNS